MVEINRKELEEFEKQKKQELYLKKSIEKQQKKKMLEEQLQKQQNKLKKM